MQIDPAETRPPRASRPCGALFLLALALQGCGAEPPPEATRGWSLLDRKPDRLIEQPGVLIPDWETQWGSLGLVGWDARTHRRDGMPYVWSRTTNSALTIPAGPHRDRTLELTLWCPAAERDAQTAVVKLNDVVVGRTAICSERETRRIETPAVLWQEGDNSLEIEIEEVRAPPEEVEVHVVSGTAPNPRAGIALARVAYDIERRPVVDPATGQLELADGTAAFYEVQAITPIDLQMTAKPSGPGVLSLETARIDADTGEVLEELRRFDLDVASAGVDRRFPIESQPGDLLRLRVGWRAGEGTGGDAVLRFERLEVIDRTPVERFPVILIAIDTLTAEHLSTYGYARETSPRLDELARDSVLFEHCVSNATWTLPSFMSLMTGQFAASHRINENLIEGGAIELWERWSLADNRWTLAEALRASGWHTAGMVDTWWLGDRFQFPQGFDHYDLSASAIPKVDPEGGIRHVSRLALEWLDLLPSAEAAASARRQLAGAHGALDAGPFFLFLHCFDVHGPYAADARFDSRFEGDALYETEHTRYAGAAGSTFGAIHEYITAPHFPPGETPPALPTGPILADYDEGIALTDDAVGKLLDGLKARGIYDDALIIVVADHGEAMGEGEVPFAHEVLDETAIHVPLIVKLPKGAEKGRRVRETVQLVDVYPTVLDLVGLRPERSMLHGRSLVPLMRGESLPDVPTLCESGIIAQAAVHLGDWKLVVKAPGFDSGDQALLTYPRLPPNWLQEHFPELLEGALTEQLYASYREREDFRPTMQRLRRALRTYVEVGLYRPREDPDEEHDLGAEHPEKLREMAAMMFDLIAKRHQARLVAKLPMTTVQPSEEDLATLRSLGYAGE